MYDRFEILKEIDEWEKEIARLEDSDEDESEQIAEIQKRIDALNDALEANLEQIEFGGTEFVNVLLIGEAGTGKTSRVFAWAKKHKINIHFCPLHKILTRLLYINIIKIISYKFFLCYTTCITI